MNSYFKKFLKSYAELKLTTSASALVSKARIMSFIRKTHTAEIDIGFQLLKKEKQFYNRLKWCRPIFSELRVTDVKPSTIQ